MSTIQSFNDLKRLSAGIRIRLVSMLCAVVVPVLALALCWTFYELAVVSEIRIHSAEDTVTLTAGRLSQLLTSTRIASRAFLTNAGKAEQESFCRRIRPVLRDIAVADLGVAFYNGKGLSCSTMEPASSWVSHRNLARITERLQLHPEQLLLISGAESFPLALIVPNTEDGSGAFSIFAVPSLRFAPYLDLSSLQNAKSIAIVTADGHALNISHEVPEDVATVGDWLPKDLSQLTLAKTSHSFKSYAQNDVESLFVTAPIGTSGARLLATYKASPVFTVERQQFYQVAFSFLVILTAMIIGIVWALDRSLMRWIIYLRRIAIAHAKGRWSVRAAKFEEAPNELRELAQAVNSMAEHISDHAHMLETALAEKAALLQELHHRVKNNFQVIASLLSLHKKGLPPERWSETRFLEEHVRAMAIAYRTSYTTGSPTGVPPIQLISDVIEALRETANIRVDCIRMVAAPDKNDVDLDKAIAISLYIAYFLPPYLTRDINSKHPLTIDAFLENSSLKLVLTNLPHREALQSSLRERLCEAYARQLGIFVRISADDTALSIDLPLQDTAETIAA